MICRCFGRTHLAITAVSLGHKYKIWHFSLAGEWLVRLANFENFKHCVVVEFHIRVGESYYCSGCAGTVVLKCTDAKVQ